MQGWPKTRSGAFDSFTVSVSEVATLNIGLEDTLAYYSPDEFVVAQDCVSGRCGSSCPLGMFPRRRVGLRPRASRRPWPSSRV